MIIDKLEHEKGTGSSLVPFLLTNKKIQGKIR